MTVNGHEHDHEGHEHGVDLDFDLDTPEMQLTCPEGWMIHFQHNKVSDQVHMVEFSVGVIVERLGDAVDKALGMAESLMEANYMAMPDEESEVAIGFDPLGQAYAPDGTPVELSDEDEDHHA